MKGIEPSYAAWEAAVLPLNYTRDSPAAKRETNRLRVVRDMKKDVLRTILEIREDRRGLQEHLALRRFFARWPFVTRDKGSAGSEADFF